MECVNVVAPAEAICSREKRQRRTGARFGKVVSQHSYAHAVSGFLPPFD